MTKTMEVKIQEAFNMELAPSKVGDLTPNELAEYLVKNGIVKETADVNRLVVEALQRAYREDDEFPIHFYGKDEEMPETAKACAVKEALTDDYVNQMKAGN